MCPAIDKYSKDEIMIYVIPAIVVGKTAPYKPAYLGQEGPKEAEHYRFLQLF